MQNEAIAQWNCYHPAHSLNAGVTAGRQMGVPIPPETATGSAAGALQASAPFYAPSAAPTTAGGLAAAHDVAPDMPSDINVEEAR